MLDANRDSFSTFQISRKFIFLNRPVIPEDFIDTAKTQIKINVCNIYDKKKYISRLSIFEIYHELDLVINSIGSYMVKIYYAGYRKIKHKVLLILSQNFISQT